jgi:hypothetical protein
VDGAVGLLFNNVPLVLVLAEAVGDSEAIMHEFDVRGLESQLIGVTEPLPEISGGRGTIVSGPEPFRRDGAELHLGIEAAREIVPRLPLEGSNEASSYIK